MRARVISVCFMFFVLFFFSWFLFSVASTSATDQSVRLIVTYYVCVTFLAF